MLKKSKGFTLVELIIVIVIIGILAAVTVVGYTSQTSKARASSVYVSLSESVKAANVCLAGGNALTAAAAAANIGGTAVCTLAAGNTVLDATANWPVLSAATVGGTWTYKDTTVAGTPAGTAVTTNSITASALVIMAGSPTGAASAWVAADSAVKCTNTGCQKYNFPS